MTILNKFTLSGLMLIAISLFVGAAFLLLSPDMGEQVEWMKVIVFITGGAGLLLIVGFLIALLIGSIRYAMESRAESKETA